MRETAWIQESRAGVSLVEGVYFKAEGCDYLSHEGVWYCLSKVMGEGSILTSDEEVDA
jgi:hypothetical protein